MKKGFMLSLFIVIIFIIAGCQKDRLVDNHIIYAHSNEVVELEANKGYKTYHWTQTEGKQVLINDFDSRIATFIAPNVNIQEKLKFQITAVTFDGASVSDTVEVIVDPAKNTSSVFKDIKKLILKVSKNRLNVDTNTTFSLKAFYKDGSEKYVSPKSIKWSVVPKGAVEIKGNLLIAKQDGNVSITAIAGNTASNTVKLNIYWKVDGHLLPPEPDPKINNATLLGVDVNHNGVRDDVERWIYKKYSKYYPCRIKVVKVVAPDGKVFDSDEKICSKIPVPYHPAIRAAVMDVARAAQIIIKDPKKAKETVEIYRKAYYCAWSVSNLKDKSGRKLSQDEIVGKEFEYKQFNTAQRARAYAKFNYYLSGGMFWSPSDKYVLKNWCSTKIKELIQGLQK